MTRRKASASPVAPTALLGDIRALIEAARQRAASAVNSELTMLYWRIGQRIHTQVLEGRRADYGEEVVPTLAAQLVKEYGNSFSVKNLRRMVQFAATFPDERIVVSLTGPHTRKLARRPARLAPRPASCWHRCWPRVGNSAVY